MLFDVSPPCHDKMPHFTPLIRHAFAIHHHVIALMMFVAFAYAPFSDDAAAAYIFTHAMPLRLPPLPPAISLRCFADAAAFAMPSSPLFMALPRRLYAAAAAHYMLFVFFLYVIIFAFADMRHAIFFRWLSLPAIAAFAMIARFRCATYYFLRRHYAAATLITPH